jgi:hypothetical protein
MDINSDQKFKELMNDCKTEIPVPVNFQSEVWNRIAMREQGRPSSFWSEFEQFFQTFFGRPQYAAGGLIAVFFISIAAGQFQLKTLADHQSISLQNRYIASIDPYTMSQRSK